LKFPGSAPKLTAAKIETAAKDASKTDFIYSPRYPLIHYSGTDFDELKLTREV
jgi:hypothetical protein